MKRSPTVAGAAPLQQSSTNLLCPLERGERGGAAAAPAGRELPQEARAAAELEGGENRFESSVS